MKILKIFGFVVGVHLFALILIFANPGCSTTTRPPPAPIDTVLQNETAPVVAPNLDMAASAGSTAAPVQFDPNAPAVAAPVSDVGGVRFVPTRPGTPVAGALTAEPVADVTPASSYVVKAGDSLWSIAKKYKLAVADLTRANGIAANAHLQPGRKLVIPGKSMPASPAATGAAAKAPVVEQPAPARAAAAGEVVKHTVRTGETLGTIARNYGVRQADIAVANHISDPAKIQAGMELVIPGWQPTGAKAGKSAAPKQSAAPAAGKATEAQPAAPVAEQPASPASVAPAVPVIRIEEDPVVTPAPKS